MESCQLGFISTFLWQNFPKFIKYTLPVNSKDDEEVSASKKADEQRKPSDSYQIWSL